MNTSINEMISMLLPRSAAETDMAIERFDEWHNPKDTDGAPTTTCVCG